MLQTESVNTRITFDPTERILHAYAQHGSRFDKQAAWDNHADIAKLCNRQPCWVIFESDGDIVLTSDMRSACASPEFNEFFIAVALVSPSITMKMLGNFYLRVNRPVVPTRFFTTSDQATAWIKKQQELTNPA